MNIVEPTVLFLYFNFSQGFNILLHGVGSKIGLLERFIDEQISDYNHLVINGFFPSLTIKSVRPLGATWYWT